jgi:hypothetical protein
VRKPGDKWDTHAAQGTREHLPGESVCCGNDAGGTLKYLKLTLETTFPMIG